ncbi:restriction endonuclease subunit S [Acinetobacter baumannii]|uniref:restriction endonuclease subunit S n=1 Tax=Acinetobacter baumannii TaxID=470 RepID=UPI003F19B71F
MARKIDPTSIPKEWKYDLLDKFAVRCSGHTPSQSFPEYWDGGIKWISLADSNRLDKGYIFNTSKEISEEGVKNSSAVLLPAETVVLSRDAGIGKSAVMYEPMAVSQHFIAWKCDNSHKINSWFLYNWLQLNKTEFERQAVGSTIKTIGLPYFKKLKIALPPYQEQEKITQILSTWDQAISATEKLLENSQQQKKALMQQLLTGKKRLLDENGERFSGDWNTATLGEIGEIKSAGVDKKIVDGEIPIRLLNFTDVFKRNFIYSDELNHWVTAPISKVESCDVRKGDVFFTPSSETRDETGIPAVAAEDIPNCCYSYHIVRFRISEQWDLNFKAYAFTTSNFRKQIDRLADGSGQRYVVSQDNFRSIIVNYPNFEEQVAIGKVLKSAEDEIHFLQRKLDCLKQEKKALMQQLLTGKRRVKV